jgi:Holliday junction DNA helicase RuvA
VTELKDRASAWSLGVPQAVGAVRASAPADGGAPDAVRDAVAALVGLQFRPVEAQGAVATAARRLGAAASTNELVRLALQEIGR